MKKIYLIPNIIFSVLSLLVFIAPLVPPSSGWVFGFLAFLVPVFLFLNFTHFVFLLLKKRKFAIIPGILFLWSMQFFPALLSFHDEKELPASANQFRVLSYNVSYFRKTPHWKRFRDIYTDPEKNQNVIRAKDWLLKNNADIYCFQEFYDDPDSEFYNIVEALARDSTYAVFMSGKYHRRRPLFINGIGIISRFPIIQKGQVDEGADILENRYIYADMRINEDTLRIINLHLHSMMINPLPAKKSVSALWKYTKDTYHRIKTGLLIHEQQAQTVLGFIKKSPHPVIVAGDFNEIPFGYVYRCFNNFMNNSFEEAGSGFGFTLNTTFPFLRIDHQFYEPGQLEAVQYQTIREIDISEHYPIQTVYRFIK